MTKLVLTAILCLVARVLTYFGIAQRDKSLLMVTHNPLFIESLPGGRFVWRGYQALVAGDR